MKLIDNVLKKFGYEATIDNSRRKVHSTTIKHESEVLKLNDWKKLINTTHDGMRNTTILRYMINKHLDYTTSYMPHIKTGNSEFNDYVESKLKFMSLAKNCDHSNRHSLRNILRLMESSVILAGDGFLYKTKEGKLQIIEADRIAKPSDLMSIPIKYQKEINDFGLILDKNGATKFYCVCNRNGNDRIFNSLVPSEDMIVSGEYMRADQIRGISPLTGALNMLADLHDSYEYTLLKIKLHSLFGIAVKRAPGAAPDSNNGFDTTGYSGTSYASAGTARTPYEMKFQNGIMALDMDPGDSIDTIQSNTPSSEMVDYTQLITRLILLALDIPYSFYNSMGSSYDARIADRAEYEESVTRKRERVLNVLMEYTEFAYAWMFDNDKEFKKTIKTSGVDIEDLYKNTEWLSAGIPWIDKLKEVQGDEKAIALGIDSRQRACRRRGGDFFKIVDELSEEEAYMNAKGVSFAIGTPGQALPSNDQTPTDNQEVLQQ